MGTRAARVDARLVLVSVALCASSACVVARPTSPRITTVGSTSIGLDHLRRDTVAVSVHGARVTSGWIVDGPPAAATCKGGVAADAVGAETHGLTAPEGSSLVELRFPGGLLFQHLTRPSSLALQLDDASCAVLPLAGTDPSLAYRIGAGGGPWNIGAMFSTFVPLTGSRDVGWGTLEWDPIRVGKWMGPVRPTVAVGLSLTSRLKAVHVSGVLMGYPLVFRRLAIGVGAGYELRPSWSSAFADGDRFKWVHGPRVELHLVAVGPTLLGFPPPVRMSKIGLALWASRLDADGFSATILGVGFVRE